MKNRIMTTLVLMSISIVINCSAMDSKLSFLQTRDTDIVTEDGKKIFLRGVTFSVWLERNGSAFLLLYTGDDFSRILEEKIGREKTAQFFNLLEDNFISPEDFSNVKDMGLNIIRLPFHYTYVQEKGFTKLDDAIKWAKEAGVYIMPCIFTVPGGHNAGKTGLYDNSEYQEEFIRMWEDIAERYKNEPALAGYELLNEPDTDKEVLGDLYERTIARIRKIDNRHIIFLDANFYGYDFKVFDHSFGDSIVYVFHTYDRPGDEVRRNIGEYRKFQDKFKGPLICNEFGGHDGYAPIPIFEQEDISWITWAHKNSFALYYGNVADDIANFAYCLPYNSPYGSWLASIQEELSANEKNMKDEALKIVDESNLSEKCKIEVKRKIRLNPFGGEFKNLMKKFRFIRKKYRKDSKELEKISNKWNDIFISYRMNITAESFAKMDKNEMIKLMESLQTQYWLRGNREFIFNK